MRVGDLVRLPDARLALVLQTWPRGPNRRKRLEVFVPGSTPEGGSVLSVDDDSCTWAGNVSVELPLRAGRKARCAVVLNGVVRRVEVEAGEGWGTAEVRKRAAWEVLAKGGGR